MEVIYIHPRSQVSDCLLAKCLIDTSSKFSENVINLWTAYEIQRSSWQVSDVGVGFFFVEERQGDLANTFQLPSYLRTDAAIFYRRVGEARRRHQFRTALNFRNLFDVDYFEGSLGSNVFPGALFTVQGTVSWEF